MQKRLSFVCDYCDSEYEIVYDTAGAIGVPDFCPFCSEERDITRGYGEVEDDFDEYSETTELDEEL